MRNTTRRARLGTLGVAAALALTACGGGSDDAAGSTESEGGDGGLTPVKLQLQWLTQAQFSGYYAALDQGYYEDEGLEVEIIPSGGDIVPQDALANGEVDYAVAWVPKVLGSIEQGADITNVAQIFERSATLQVSFADAGIDSVADLVDRVPAWAEAYPGTAGPAGPQG